MLCGTEVPERVASVILPSGMFDPEKRRAKPLDRSALMEYALRSLSGRAQSVGELREKLRRRAALMGDVDEVLAQLKDTGYLNDRRFAEGFGVRRPSRRCHEHAGVQVGQWVA